MAESNSIWKQSALHEETWNAWMKKNTDRDKAQFRKLVRMAGIALIIGMACLLIWAWTQHGVIRVQEKGEIAENQGVIRQPAS